MARVLPVLCALLFFFAVASAQLNLGSVVRQITFDSVDKKITYTLLIETDATLSNSPFLDVEIDGKQNNNAVVIDDNGIEIEVSLPNVVPVTPKPTPNPPKRTSNPPKPTPKPSVSDAFGSAFSPVMALISMAAAGLCRGLTQNNRLSFGLFVVLVLAVALATESDAASSIAAKKVVATLTLPTGWTTQDGLPPHSKTIGTKGYTVFLTLPTPSASVTPSKSLTPSVSKTNSITPSPSM